MNAKEKMEKILIDIEDLVLNDISRATDISEQIAMNMVMGYRELNEIFKFFTDRSLKEYIRERKMMAAYELILAQDKMNVEKAIEISGLDNQSSFSKKFKEVFGVTPQEAFDKKDQTKYCPPLSWESIVTIESHNNGKQSLKKEDTDYFGVSFEQYNKIIQAQECQALYDFNDNQSLTAFKISESEKVSLKDAYSFVDDYLNYRKVINDKCIENDELEFLLSPLSKKLKQIYFSVAESISEAIDMIYTAQENNYSLTKKNIVYLSVYCKEPHCDFDEFLQQVERFEKLNGNDFEEYWNLIYSFGFSPEDAVKDFYDSLEADMDTIKLDKTGHIIYDETDDMFEKWAKEETDYANHDRMDTYYDEDNPYYLNDRD